MEKGGSDATSLLTSSEERGAKQVRLTGREDISRGERGGDVLNLLCKVYDKLSAVREEEGGRVEERREHREKFPRVGGGRVDLCKVEGRFGC